MSTQNNSTIYVGVGFTGLLFLVFLALKLAGVIDWSWWWVTTPLWGGAVLSLFLCLVAAFVVVLLLVRRGFEP